jgi:hypothetical protein
MAQRKENKKRIRVRDLQPKKDAKGGFVMNAQSISAQSPKQQDGGGNPAPSRIFGP